MNESREEPIRFYGKYRGLVVDDQDPQQLGRLKARVPEVLGEVESDWAQPCVPYAGDGSGQYTVPARDTGVWIEFEAGDPSRPIWSGCWWHPGQLPAGNGGKSGAPSLKIIRSEQGLMLAFDDSSGIAWTGDLALTGAVGSRTRRFGDSSSALTGDQLQNISNDGNPVFIDENGYLTTTKGTLIMVR